jgi:hypothetical protein
MAVNQRREGLLIALDTKSPQQLAIAFARLSVSPKGTEIGKDAGHRFLSPY